VRCQLSPVRHVFHSRCHGISGGNLKRITMKHIAFRIIVLCVLLPPVCYGVTVQALEYYLGKKYTRGIEQVCVGDTEPLFRGSIRLKDAVGANINRYLHQQRFLSIGVRATVWVTTAAGVVLYPAPVDVDDSALLLPDEAMEVASENYSLLSDGLLVTVDVELGFGRLLSNIILGSYLLLTVMVLYGVYRAGIRKTEATEAEMNENLRRLEMQAEEFSTRLSALRADREQLEKALQAERQKAGSNEADLFDEIVELDEKLSQNLLLQQEQEKEIKTLTDQIHAYESRRKKPGVSKGKEIDLAAKRFGALYKNLSLHERAVEGFCGLPEEMKIKAEEIVHRLNEAPDQVPIKRKVFSGKGHKTVLEVLFSYNGRLYFRRSKDLQVEVLAIGNKNSQPRDLEFIDKISRRS
jgi:hypothetical protein